MVQIILLMYSVLQIYLQQSRTLRLKTLVEVKGNINRSDILSTHPVMIQSINYTFSASLQIYAIWPSSSDSSVTFIRSATLPPPQYSITICQNLNQNSETIFNKQIKKVYPKEMSKQGRTFVETGEEKRS